MEFQTYTLGNGLRVILLPTRSRVVYCGYAIAAGSRHEEPGEEGLAHFCEHLTFKGTEHRSALQILNSLERVGGDLNAFTNKEHTVYYAMVMQQHLGRAIDLLTDIVFASTYPQAEIDKEVEVVCDEIESYNDSPAELIYDEFENLLFNNHPLGHAILGEAKQLHTYTTADALRFARRHYRPDNAVFFVSADVTMKQLVRMTEARMEGVREFEGTGVRGYEGARLPSGLPSQNISALPPQHNPGLSAQDIPDLSSASREIIRHRGTHQAHVVVGCPAFNMHDDRRIALFLLNNILGGPAMNSRLNLALRERRGLVYTVESSMATYSDTGVWTTYFGCDTKDVKRCLRLVRHELDRLMERPLSESQLRAAKRQLIGQLTIATDNRENFTIDVAKNYLYGGWEKDIDQLLAKIEALTAQQLHEVACLLFTEQRMTTLAYE